MMRAPCLSHRQVNRRHTLSLRLVTPLKTGTCAARRRRREGGLALRQNEHEEALHSASLAARQRTALHTQLYVLQLSAHNRVMQRRTESVRREDD